MTAIRLADRKGSLVGDLSKVQEFALTILMWQEKQDREDARIDQVKLALLASRKSTMEILFPEYVPQRDDDGPGIYESDTDTSAARKLIDMIDQLETTGTLKLEDLNGGGNGRI